MSLDNNLLEKILIFQQNEINEHNVYSFLSRRTKGKNSKILNKISQDELRHYNFWKQITKKDIPAKKISVLKYLILATVFGLTFSIIKMEKQEEKAQIAYTEISKKIPKAYTHILEENKHEKALFEMLDENRLNYLSSIISGLNDAWIELVGELAGFTFAFQDPRIIGFAGLIAGIAQFLSSSASEIQIFLTRRNEQTRSALKASVYEGVAYLITVGLLIFPYFVLENYWMAFLITVVSVFFVLSLLTYYLSVVRGLSLRSMFPIMLGIMAGVGSLAYVIGLIAKTILGI
jgi:VIT1/CCC1 family predicted Fe2+/Mn2+ transporter